MSTAVLSVRVSRRLKEEAERLGIDIRRVVEKALEEEVRRAKMERFRRLMKEALESMDVSEEEWVKTIRGIREER
ncbi:type II toxin-antitoxin system CcdA family antitoxin [Pyrofollis japonicus]|uniref:type II toxin-antitoxin system CcdA family antitoxin n=1 Tax=Pyrofollis japonicus TaxID=3060460 RepID=UPI00295A796B|nr:type II toxin-antitoxin system CcdA family antitoxin [Pyrofollis japonicus]